jgi:hypothetical protein
MISTTEEYVQALSSGKVDKVQGVCGRILRGACEKDFETLTDDPANRRIVFPTDETGLESLLGKSGYEMLITIGYPPDYTEALVKKGKQFKLVVFPEGKDAVTATWMNVVRVVGVAYPEIKQRLWRHGQVLMTYGYENWAAFEKKTGKTSENLNEVKSNGSSHPEFMTFERYKAVADTPENARLFLYFTVGLNNLFYGDGYTRDENGRKGIKEYLMANKPIVDIDGSKLVDIEVTIP